MTGKTELGQQLRYWRGLRGKSQLELSLDTGISQRHVSFIESGRSVPSRQALMTIAEAMDIPLRERNHLLLIAGFAPLYAEDAWDSAEMHSLSKVMTRMLKQHDPFPAIVMDRYWNVLQANDSAPRFFSAFIDLDARPKPRNMLHLMFDPAAMRPFLCNWEAASSALLQRVRREAVGNVLDEQSQALLAQLMAYSQTPMQDKPGLASQPAATLPFVPLDFAWGNRVLSYFSMVTTAVTPLAVTTQELRIESLFPANEMTETWHEELMASLPVR